MPRTNINGINLYYEVHGQGEPLVLIQGFGGEHTGWFFQVPWFKRYFKVVTFDSRGTGKTERANLPCTVRMMADDVACLMDYLGIHKVNLLGLSLGGMVAQEFAITCPERVNKLILGNTFATLERITDKLDSIPSASVKEDASDTIQDINFDKLMNFMVSAAFNRPFYRKVILLLRRIPRSIDTRGYLEQIEAIRGYSTLDRLHLIQSPTLVITGDMDRVVPPDCSELIAKHIPGAKLVIVAGGSHALFMEMSSRFNREVMGFLLGE